MAASYYERIIGLGDYADDGGVIDAGVTLQFLRLYAAGILPVSWYRTAWALTTPQSAEFDTLLATQPSSGLLATLINAKALAQWPDRVGAALALAQSTWEYPTAASLKTALGV